MKIIYDNLAELAQTAATCEELFKDGKCSLCALSESCDQTLRVESRAILRGAKVTKKDGGYR